MRSRHSVEMQARYGTTGTVVVSVPASERLLCGVPLVTRPSFAIRKACRAALAKLRRSHPFPSEFRFWERETDKSAPRATHRVIRLDEKSARRESVSFAHLASQHRRRRFPLFETISCRIGRSGGRSATSQRKRNLRPCLKWTGAT